MTKIYYAPKPRYSDWVWFRFIALRVVVFPVLLWDLIKLGANKLFGELVGGLVLPAQNQNFHVLGIKEDSVHNYNEGDLTCEKHKIIIRGETELDTFEIKHKSQENIDPKYQKYIINFVGNGMCYEHIIDDMKEDANALKANVVGFNLRGVGLSTGKAKSKDDLVTDGIAQVQRLLDQGISPQNITLKGHSLGAGVASLVAKHFHQLKQPINLFNSRSFSTITNFLVGHVRLERDEHGQAIGHKDSIGGIILGWLAKPFVKFGVALAKWEINAGSAFKSIPEAYRDYIVVRSRKALRGNRFDDAVIPHYASIHKELTSERRAKKANIDEAIKKLDGKIKKADPLAKLRLANEREALVQAREKIKSDKKMETFLPYMEGHNIDSSSLQNRSGKDAQTFFRDFVEKAEEDHGIKNTLKSK
jgi:pimeloyl-ACP methyl ester carboxylesterase